ncbi:hypothetical protein F4778DRAFT_139847 [Xylariomycetidae sp. FL2044]|nr:hypothetical protein F4778DRAFT_139847 [Xylariomycetidae sp. FL2044]
MGRKLNRGRKKTTLKRRQREGKEVCQPSKPHLLPHFYHLYISIRVRICHGPTVSTTRRHRESDILRYDIIQYNTYGAYTTKRTASRSNTFSLKYSLAQILSRSLTHSRRSLPPAPYHTPTLPYKYHTIRTRKTRIRPEQVVDSRAEQTTSCPFSSSILLPSLILSFPWYLHTYLEPSHSVTYARAYIHLGFSLHTPQIDTATSTTVTITTTITITIIPATITTITTPATITITTATTTTTTSTATTAPTTAATMADQLNRNPNHNRNPNLNLNNNNRNLNPNQNPNHNPPPNPFSYTTLLLHIRLPHHPFFLRRRTPTTPTTPALIITLTIRWRRLLTRILLVWIITCVLVLELTERPDLLVARCAYVLLLLGLTLRHHFLVGEGL